ncbi:hypothetical protein R1sor_004793 [Riccia sorocarpa]|uniref:Stress-response A/B barrel domain-containing protein n=1 Tax=Riccia sorocarpa TaxID=122646 RepID=A0ABD3HHZ4_9MARC
MHVGKRQAVVEHLVLARLREGISVDQWDDLWKKLDLIRGLAGVVSLHVGLARPLVGETYNFALHARFTDSAALKVYEADELYAEAILKSSVSNDLRIFNWECQPQGSMIGSNFYAAAHVGFMKFKSDTSEQKIEEAMSTIRDLQRLFPQLVSEVSVGRAFAIVPADLGESKGLEVAFVVSCPTIQACEELALKSADTNLSKQTGLSFESCLDSIHVVKFNVDWHREASMVIVIAEHLLGHVAKLNP